ncbi:MAG: alanyl-tRNA editing protein [Acidobacteria bacterium]|nr:alanyl-tRNA editing protein [Acidobacteriota bacterium]
MTHRLYYTDCYLRDFTARVVERSAGDATVVLDRTAFYPTSGGQPHDLGTLAGVPVLEVSDTEDGRVTHRLAAPLPADAAAGEIAGAVDWPRRFDHMQQHTGQHLLSAVFEELFSLHTVSFHLGAESATIDLEGGPVSPAAVLAAERRANELVFENRPVTIQFEDARAARGLRKPSERDGEIRIVTIDAYDRSACGGTHVRSTGEIGPILLRKLEKIRQSVRVEFVCGGRALQRARADYESLNKVAQLFSASLDETPAMAAALIESARAGEKAQRKLELDLAGYRGKELYAATAPDPDGVRRVTQWTARGSLEELRAVAQNFTAQPRAVFLAVLEDPPSVLLAASEDAGVDAGKLVKAAVTAAGGRGGGNPRIAQGSVPQAGLLSQVVEQLVG